MINVSLRDRIPSVQQTIQILNFHTSKMGVPVDYDRMLEYNYYYRIASSVYKKRTEEFVPRKYKDSLKGVTDALMIQYLQSVVRDMSVFLTTDKGAISLGVPSIDAAIASGGLSDEISHMLSLYKKSKMCASKVSLFDTFIKNCIPTNMKTFDGYRLALLRPVYVEQNTGRIGTQVFAITNIPRECKDIETVPAGWIRLEVDSGQIEPRIGQSQILQDKQLMYLTNLYNDAYFGYIHYAVYLSDDERSSGTFDIKPIVITDELKAMRQEIKVYANSVLYGSTENNAKDPIKDKLIRYIGGHVNRLALVNEIERKLDNKDYKFYTAFGTPIEINKGGTDAQKRARGEEAYRRHLLFCGINNPVQGTAGDLMRISVSKAHNLLTSKAPNSVITTYIHDAGYFAVHWKDYDKVVDELREITAYQVEDWLPIHAEALEGKTENKDFPRLLFNGAVPKF